jgi:hypothetical protein
MDYRATMGRVIGVFSEVVADERASNRRLEEYQGRARLSLQLLRRTVLPFVLVPEQVASRIT